VFGVHVSSMRQRDWPRRSAKLLTPGTARRLAPVNGGADLLYQVEEFRAVLLYCGLFEHPRLKRNSASAILNVLCR
jgi:hypothetical protein